MAELETHPHLHLFNPDKRWKYLIIGTFPPNTAIREKSYIDYFYGNKGFLWKIIHDIYKPQGYDFFKGTMQENVSEITRWQNDYCVGLSDTILQCRRKHPLSSQDSDLTDITYNTPLKPYILANLQHLTKIIFTSSFGKNSAYENFKKIMGEDLHRVQQKLVTGLPSPSGSANITFFNTNREETLGLTDDFYSYVMENRPELIEEFKLRWELKKKKRDSASREIIIPTTPKGLVKDFKLWRYSRVLPQEKCL